MKLGKKEFSVGTVNLKNQLHDRIPFFNAKSKTSYFKESITSIKDFLRLMEFCRLHLSNVEIHECLEKPLKKRQILLGEILVYFIDLSFV